MKFSEYGCLEINGKIIPASSAPILNLGVSAKNCSIELEKLIKALNLWHPPIKKRKKRLHKKLGFGIKIVCV